MKYYFVDYTKRVLKSGILYDKLILIATCKKIQLIKNFLTIIFFLFKAFFECYFSDV